MTHPSSEQELREAAHRIAEKAVHARRARFSKEAQGGLMDSVRPYLDKARAHWDTAMAGPSGPSVRAGLWSALAGAGVGGAVGLGAHLASDQPTKRPLSNMFTGALLGAGLGGLGGFGAHRFLGETPPGLPFTPEDAAGWKGLP